jgi:hypothetical protein
MDCTAELGRPSKAKLLYYDLVDVCCEEYIREGQFRGELKLKEKLYGTVQLIQPPD